MRLGNRPPTVASPLQNAAPPLSSPLWAEKYTLRFGNEPAAKPAVHPAPTSSWWNSAKEGLKILLPATLAAGALYQNGNLVKHLDGMEKNISNMSKAIADNAPKPLSATQWLWGKAKSVYVMGGIALNTAIGIVTWKSGCDEFNWFPGFYAQRDQTVSVVDKLKYNIINGPLSYLENALLSLGAPR